jgi:hypothetical protein
VDWRDAVMLDSTVLLLFALLIGHALCDYPLQGDFVGKFKSHKVASPVPGTTIWPHLLTAHALIHAGMVWAITQSPTMAVLEFVLHWGIDFAKSHGWTNFHHDQGLHVLCKVGYSLC